MNLIANYSCDCSGTGFKRDPNDLAGDNCNLDINECETLSPPCENNATCLNTRGNYTCTCPSDYCGFRCGHKDPCQMDPMLCSNEGVCKSSEGICDEEPFYKCICAPGWEGSLCRVKSSRHAGDVALIVGPVVGGMFFVAIVGVLVFLIMARRKRRSEGKYKPASQELTSPRLQLDNIIKPPPEERLI